ncbi:hypothetical protein FA15DRAFT_671661 [Coprinopsis marcescibilis]|uniref:Uncharacterized protein n=1 Tax=Coprinopsis marcescibilis TaxID=230819 RepID=A0A5C3KPK6_COPMA|nr:hypothetical protein FA15DRAFT_671661 [Coprinopsis marcescibilis]
MSSSYQPTFHIDRKDAYASNCVNNSVDLTGANNPVVHRNVDSSFHDRRFTNFGQVNNIGRSDNLVINSPTTPRYQLDSNDWKSQHPYPIATNMDSSHLLEGSHPPGWNRPSIEYPAHRESLSPQGSYASQDLSFNRQNSPSAVFAEPGHMTPEEADRLQMVSQHQHQARHLPQASYPPVPQRPAPQATDMRPWYDSRVPAPGGHPHANTYPTSQRPQYAQRGHVHSDTAATSFKSNNPFLPLLQNKQSNANDHPVDTTTSPTGPFSPARDHSVPQAHRQMAQAPVEYR